MKAKSKSKSEVVNVSKLRTDIQSKIEKINEEINSINETKHRLVEERRALNYQNSSLEQLAAIASGKTPPKKEVKPRGKSVKSQILETLENHKGEWVSMSELHEAIGGRKQTIYCTVNILKREHAGFENQHGRYRLA